MSSSSSSSYSSGLANAAEVEHEAPAPVAGDHRQQHRAPPLGAMDVAGPQEAALEVPELVEHEQRVVAGTAEVPVPGRAFLRAVGRALRLSMSRMMPSGGRRACT